ncbi:MAG: DUF3341 domain-containing protein [Armatimonadota bacterium]
MAHGSSSAPAVHGIVAEFDDPDALVAAVKRARAAGYRKFDAYSPFPIHGLAEAMEFNDVRIPWMAFFGGLTGCMLGLGFQTFVAVVDYPWNVGGKPLFSWPQFIPITFEATVLCTGLCTFVTQFALNGLPRPYHPMFNAHNFERATQDRFFLCIESRDPQFEASSTTQFLTELGSLQVSEVAA